MKGEFADHLREIFRYRWLILCVAALAGIAGWSWRAAAPSVYRSTAVAQVIVGDGNGDDDGTVTDFRTRTLAELGATQTILQDAVARSGLAIDADDAANLLQIELRDSAGFLEVTAEGPTAGDAAALANAVVGSLTASIANDDSGGSVVKLRVVQAAEPPIGPVPQRPLAFGFLAAIVTAIAFSEGAVALRLLGGQFSPVDAAADLERATSVPTLDLDRTPAPPFYRKHLSELPAFTVVATNEVGGAVGVELARIAAGSHDRVLLIDGDQGDPRLHLRLGLERGPGLSDLAAGVQPLTAVARIGLQGGKVAVITTGSPRTITRKAHRRALELAVDTSGAGQTIVVDSLEDPRRAGGAKDGRVVGETVLVIDISDRSRRAAIERVRHIRGTVGRLTAIILVQGAALAETESP